MEKHAGHKHAMTPNSEPGFFAVFSPHMGPSDRSYYFVGVYNIVPRRQGYENQLTILNLLKIYIFLTISLYHKYLRCI